MQSQIEIKFLTPKEMANAGSIDWRYGKVDDSNLGFADKTKNRVYVRAGLDPELTKYLINHEVSHLFELEGTDEDENGIRHKKGGFMNFLKVFYDPLNLWGWTGVEGKDRQSAPFTSTRGGLGSAGTLIGSLLGSLIPGGGAIIGPAIGAALGNMAGGVTESSIAGKPNWAGNAVNAGITGGTSALGGALGMPGVTKNPGANFAGTMAGQAFGSGNATDFGKIGTRNDFGGMWNTTPSGFGDITMPANSLGQGFGLPGNTSPGGVGTGGQTGSLGLQGSNMGTGQAGITLGGQKGIDNVNNSGTAGGFSNIGSQQQMQGGQQQIDPIGFNNTNGGSFNFF